MTIQQKPIIHGRDHLPGHPDPIPGLLVAAGSYQEQILREPSLIGYWPLDDASEPALDHSTSGRDLTEPDLSPTYGAGGPFADDPAATSVYFNHASGTTAAGDYLSDQNVGTPYDFSTLAPYTFEVLMYPTALPGSDEDGIMVIWSHPGGSVGGLSMTFLPSGQVRMRRSGSTFDSGATLTLNEWVHLAMTYDGATLRIYFDGEEQANFSTASSHSASGVLRLGTIFNIIGSSWRGNLHGRLAQAAIYDTALDASTIALHANTRGAGGTGGGTAWPGSYPIVNADVASHADITPTKLSHPGGTTDFLRADGTWATPSGGGGVATDAIWDTKGDLAAATGANAAVKLPVGSNDFVLTADSGETTGIKWASVPGALVAVKDAGSVVGTRGGINFHEGSNVTLTITDDSGNDEVDVTIAAAGAGGGIVNVQVFTAGAGQTWTKPAGATMVHVVCVGAGAGGGGGASSVSTAKTGGGGGGGGAVSVVDILASDLGSTVTVNVAAGTAGGAGGVAGAGANGTNATSAGMTDFGTRVQAGGGGGGNGGQTSGRSGGAGGSVNASAVNQTPGEPSVATGVNGIAGQAVAGGSGVGTATEWGGSAGGGAPLSSGGRVGGSSIYGGPGGAGGGGVSGTNIGAVGAQGGDVQSYAAGGGGSSGAIGGNGGNGAQVTWVGQGGGSGGSGSAAAGGAGGVGGTGAGGGGGGASSSATSSAKGGDGGKGGDGLVVVVSW